MAQEIPESRGNSFVAHQAVPEIVGHLRGGGFDFISGSLVEHRQFAEVGTIEAVGLHLAAFRGETHGAHVIDGEDAEPVAFDAEAEVSEMHVRVVDEFPETPQHRRVVEILPAHQTPIAEGFHNPMPTVADSGKLRVHILEGNHGQATVLAGSVEALGLQEKTPTTVDQPGFRSRKTRGMDGLGGMEFRQQDVASAGGHRIVSFG